MSSLRFFEKGIIYFHERGCEGTHDLGIVPPEIVIIHLGELNPDAEYQPVHEVFVLGWHVLRDDKKQCHEEANGNNDRKNWQHPVSLLCGIRVADFPIPG